MLKLESVAKSKNLKKLRTESGCQSSPKIASGESIPAISFLHQFLFSLTFAFDIIATELTTTFVFSSKLKEIQLLADGGGLLVAAVGDERQAAAGPRPVRKSTKSLEKKMGV